MLISTMTAFLRAITPYTPMQNSTAPSRRNWLISIRQSFRARTMAPMTAASSTNDSAQNGSRYGPKMRSLTAWVGIGVASAGQLLVARSRRSARTP